MNTKGQGFEVFKLLIAAIVAGAILAILLPLLNIDFTGRDPTTVAAEKIKAGITLPGTSLFTDTVSFKKNQPLVASTLANNSRQLNEDQVCVSKGDFENDPTFDDSQRPGKQIAYTGTGKAVKMVVLCDSGTKISESAGSLPGLKSEWLGPCEGFDSSDQMFCLVALKYNS
ncbi:MAG: hypothetical protein AABW85_00945 [archaeon]